MPAPANAAQRHKFLKAQYQVKNWGEYDRAWQERGRLMLWGSRRRRWRLGMRPRQAGEDGPSTTQLKHGKRARRT